MGIVKLMVADNPAADRHEEFFEHPSLERILDAISAMDGHRKTYVVLHPTEEPENIFLIVGGGEAGRFVVDYWNEDTGDEYNAIDPTVTSTASVDVPMGQVIGKRADQIVDLATALKAATVYATTGTLAEDVCWRKG